MSTIPAVPKEVPADAGRSSTSTIRGEVFNPVANHERLMNDPAGMMNKDPKNTQISHLEGHTRPQHRRGDTGDGRHILQEEEAPEVLGFAWSSRKKWTTLTVIFIVQCSMNYNAAVYANGTAFLQEKFDISAQAARVGQMIFLISYAFGCEAWAPWSEELGRRWVLQLSLFLVNIWQILAALAPNFGSVIVARFLGGISSAGGSVTLGMVADLYDPNEQQWAVAFIVFSSVGGSVIGPIVGPFIAAHLDWGWICWTQLIFGGFVQILHLLIVPETRATILLDREAKRRREAGEHNIYGPSEIKTFKEKFSLHEMAKTFCRPFVMFVTEPIVLCLSLLSGFSDALIFTFMEAFTPVYEQWGFDTVHMALAFVPIAIGYFLAYLIYIPPLMKQRKVLRENPDAAPELRLHPLLYLAPLETIGLFGFAWTSLGPPHVHWIAPMIFSCLVGIANYAIYMSTIDYMIAAYGPYSASATGGNGMARDFLAGVAALYATPFYTNVGGSSYRLHLEWPSTILAIIALLVAIPIYIFYYYGAWFRQRSKFAMSLAGERLERRVSRLEEKKMDA
ncbi:multidrug transporter, putative [Cryptococcus deneoformans JEC21]|uniref:Multidrug transporter, putative n=1 Tax=Cryptococcus deneoformans (strain JEC21 / ATCC MYA-565) TaxID=214684 RepID=Q5KHE0_CRYD1|nr:multidrug transporter, putative [Cryptococcus neoformans var. neoformans JEC21]AAW43436.1 multidrug transporter, putative [Cryptococcus neoformans var. neoformans JEC21]